MDYQEFVDEPLLDQLKRKKSVLSLWNLDKMHPGPLLLLNLDNSKISSVNGKFHGQLMLNYKRSDKDNVEFTGHLHFPSGIIVPIRINFWADGEFLSKGVLYISDEPKYNLGVRTLVSKQ